MNDVRRLLRFVRPYWRRALAALALLTTAVFGDLAIPRLIQRIIDQGIARGNQAVVVQTALIMLSISAVATLIFNSGKMVCTGAKSEKEAHRAVMTVVKELKKGGIIIISKPEFKVQNIVASVSLGGKVDLEQAVSKLVKTMYEPEQFPGLIYRMDEPKVVILIFASGNLVCTGAKKEQDVYDAVHKLHGTLEEQNLIFYE